MTYEELKAGFARLSQEEKRRFMQEVGLGLCQEMMQDPKMMERMLPCSRETMRQMPEPFRHWMEEWMEVGTSGGRKA
jgi:hypothetical protein